MKKLCIAFSLVVLLCLACAGYEKIRILGPLTLDLGTATGAENVLRETVKLHVYSDEQPYELWLTLGDIWGPRGSSRSEVLDGLWIQVEYEEEVIDLSGRVSYETKGEIVRFLEKGGEVLLHHSLKPTEFGGYSYKITFIYENSVYEKAGRYWLENLEFNLRDVLRGDSIGVGSAVSLIFDILPHISIVDTHYFVVLEPEKNGKAFLWPYRIALSNGQKRMDHMIQDVEVVEIFSVDENTFWTETSEGLVKVIERTAYFNPEEYLENERIRAANPTTSIFTYYVEPEQAKEMVLVWRK